MIRNVIDYLKKNNINSFGLSIAEENKLLFSDLEHEEECEIIEEYSKPSVNEVEFDTFSSYEILKRMCTIRNSHNAGSQEIPERVKFICKELQDMGIPYRLDIFPYSYGYERVESQTRYSYGYSRNLFDEDSWGSGRNLKSYSPYGTSYNRKKDYLYNVIISFYAQQPTQKSVFFTAHHDVVNLKTDNCNDNSASVCNLLELAYRLKNKTLERNVHICLTDCEEMGGLGAKDLSRKIKRGEFGEVEYIVNLELTAHGNRIWAGNAYDCKQTQKMREILKEKYNEQRVVFNDSYIFRGEGLDSVCIGTLPEDSNGNLVTKHWYICHSQYDTFEIAKQEDMNNFVDFLEKMI